MDDMQKRIAVDLGMKDIALIQAQAMLEQKDARIAALEAEVADLKDTVRKVVPLNDTVADGKAA